MQNRNGNNQQRAAFIFGILFIIAIIVIALRVQEPTLFQLFVFRVVLAIAVAGVAAIIPGFLSVQFRNVVRATGAIAVFVVVYYFNPPQLLVAKSSSNTISRVYITFADPNGSPIADAADIKLYPNVDGSPKLSADRTSWQLDISPTSRPPDGRLIIKATKESEFLAGDFVGVLGEGVYYPVTIQLTKDTSAHVSGQVLLSQADLLVPLVGVLVSVASYESEATETDKNGFFDLHAHAAAGETVLLSLRKSGFQSQAVRRQAGEQDRLPIILGRRR